jgi:lipopolysaccharide/colanic/teichoic acid biosynthesis glycosyltransferase
VIYVSTHLTESEFRELSSSHIVDDVVHPIRDIFTIGERLEFLRKVKAEAALKSRKPVKMRSRFSSYASAVTKRVFDIILSSALIILTAPLMAVIAVLVKMDSRGPVFHNSYRAGKGYRVFKFYRFRTSKVGAARLLTSLSQVNLFRDHGASFMKACHENSLTELGRFLRRTSLHELPQLVNVLKGDMSLVGNRPLPLHKASSLTSDEFAERFNAPAGITGLWQVSGKEGDHEERIRLDLAYAREHDLWMDIRILWKTPAAVRGKMKRYQRKGL